MVFVYILKSLVDGGYYIGISKDPYKRLARHNKGSVKSTRIRKPFKLIYYEKFNSYASARHREKIIKSYKGSNKFKELIS